MSVPIFFFLPFYLLPALPLHPALTVAGNAVLMSVIEGIDDSAVVLVVIAVAAIFNAVLVLQRQRPPSTPDQHHPTEVLRVFDAPCLVCLADPIVRGHRIVTNCGHTLCCSCFCSFWSASQYSACKNHISLGYPSSFRAYTGRMLSLRVPIALDRLILNGVLFPFG